MPGWRYETEWYEIFYHFFLANKNNGKLLHVIVPLCATLKCGCLGEWLSVIGTCNHWQFVKVVNKPICLSFIPVFLLLSVSKSHCAHLSSGCSGAVISFAVLLSSFFFLTILSSLFGLQLYEGSALADVCERIQHWLCVQTSPSHAIMSFSA